jgi:hypothetical protein
MKTNNFSPKFPPINASDCINQCFPRNSDSEDFYEVAVWCIKAALLEAYEAGQNASAINLDSE